MVDLTLLTDKGSFDFFILPYFRERTFPGRKGRLRFEPSIDTGRGAIYESKDEERHIDYALRYSNTIGNLDIGVSHFYGTTREPAFLAEFASNGDVSFAPYYEIIKQAGLDLQYVNDAWLWKLEAIYRRGQADGNFYALDAGAEYTFSGHGLRGMELGLIVEYLYDSREFEVDATALLAEGYISSRFNTFLDNDYMIGFRLALNDAASSEILAAVIRDIDSHSSVFQLEASRRIGDGWTVELDVYAFVDVRKDPLLDFVRRDSFAQLALRYYF